ncbi:MAG: hypothetical protein WAK16_11935 [Candidatus Cybelea sp.]|jgi:hypothetical protein
MPEKTPRTRKKKPISLVVVVIETGEATPLTPKGEAEILRGTCDLLEDRADAMDPPSTSRD